MRPSLFDVHYANGRSAVVMEADLESGWKQLRKTCGYFRSTWVPYKDDLKIRAQLAVIAQPATFAEWARSFPDIEFEGVGDETLSYTLRAKRLAITLSLSPGQPWRTTKQGRPQLYVEQVPFFRLDKDHWFDLRAWVIFHEASRPPVKDVRIWVENRLVLPGGQFESQRRRH